jgi:hypothetical protein
MVLGFVSEMGQAPYVGPGFVPVLLGLGLTIGGIVYCISYFSKDKVVVHRYKCQYCTHQWDEKIST